MCGNYLYMYVCMYVCMYVTMILPLHFSVPIYSPWQKKKKKKNSHKIKRGAGPLPGPESGTKPQGLFNSASFSHRRPHFNSDRQILRYSVLLGIHYKFNDDWWITFVPAMRLQKWRISLNREFLLICVWRPFYLW